MAEFWGKFRFWGRNPLSIVEVVIAGASIITGLYVLSPLLGLSTVANGAGTLVILLSNPILIKAYGASMFLSGLIMVVGVSKRSYRLRSAGIRTNILVRFFLLVGTLLTDGILPLTWMNNLVVILILIICYTVVRGFIYRGEW